MSDVSNMSEKDLKSKVNEFRTQISHHDRELKGIYRELKLHRTNSDDLKAKRDKLNGKVKELVTKARASRSKRDSVNEKIASLKASRNAVMEKSRAFSSEMSDLKGKRDALNKQSKGSVESLSKSYVADIDTFLNSDIPLKHEIDLFTKLIEMKDRLGAAFDANEIHEKLQETYDASKVIFDSSVDVGSDIKKLAEESQKYHLEMLALYKEVDEIRKEADLAHTQMRENYAVTAPIREKIDPLKASIASLREELEAYLEKLNELQLVKDEKKQEEHLVVAKEKLDKKGRLSLEDLKVLMEKGDLKF